jgi:SAM-dependent methyltransferase
MGRFETTVEFYARYREPYTERFFWTISQHLGFAKTESLLDVGCGPGLLALGFAPYVGKCTGIDPEPRMIAAARQAASEAGVTLRLHESRIEDFYAEAPFNLITIGRALHWLDREAAIPRLEQLAAPNALVLICGATNAAAEESPWLAAYNEFRRQWAPDEQERYKIDPRLWFEGSAIDKVVDLWVSELRQTTIDELIYRSLSKSNTSPAVLGERRAEFESGLRAVLEPFAQDGVLKEKIQGRATVFKRNS